MGRSPGLVRSGRSSGRCLGLDKWGLARPSGGVQGCPVGRMMEGGCLTTDV